MKYLCLGYVATTGLGDETPAEVEALMAQCRPHLQELYGSGHLVVDAGLAMEARFMRRKGRQVEVLDGPFLKTRDAIGAAFIIEAQDWGDAIRIAGLHPTTRVPVAEELGWRLEIRPIHHFKRGDAQ